jgi:phage shock protein E
MLTFIKEMLGLGPKTDYKALKAQGAIVVDVRTPQEYKQGHYKGAINIPLDRLSRELSGLHKKQKPVILYCRSGSRSGMAKSMLRSAGIEAYNAGSLGSVSRLLG